MQYAGESKNIKTHMQNILACLQVIEVDGETGVKIVGIATPIVACVTGMLREIELVELYGKPDWNQDPLDNGEIVLGMTVVSVGEESEVLYVKDANLDPWCFLGLLGVEVLSGLTWQAPYEKRYKDFWRKVKSNHPNVL
ncbi:UNVERIFIED_CONTAM: hypothetical protein HDU68_000038 [Siphonaria sp. JEL0065]|nr:hypothetical protein HDU68_000038 [Siphonaria sp. JEL0065]